MSLIRLKTGLVTCPIRCTVFNRGPTIDSLMFGRFSLGEFRETPLSQKIKVTKYNAGIGK